MLHLLVDFPFGIFLWLPYKIFTSNFKMLIEDRKMKNPWIWIQTNLFPIKWIEKTFVRVKIVGQSEKFKLFFTVRETTWNSIFFLHCSLVFFLYDFFKFWTKFEKSNLGDLARRLTTINIGQFGNSCKKCHMLNI